MFKKGSKWKCISDQWYYFKLGKVYRCQKDDEHLWLLDDGNKTNKVYKLNDFEKYKFRNRIKIKKLFINNDIKVLRKVINDYKNKPIMVNNSLDKNRGKIEIKTSYVRFKNTIDSMLARNLLNIGAHFVSSQNHNNFRINHNTYLEAIKLLNILTQMKYIKISATSVIILVISSIIALFI